MKGAHSDSGDSETVDFFDECATSTPDLFWRKHVFHCIRVICILLTFTSS